jgi:hypothetical protein
MFTDAIFQSFATKRPIAVMSQLALCRLLDGDLVDEIFSNHAEQQYQRTLLFSSLTKLMSSVVMSKHASVNAAYKKMKAELGVSLNAVYNKLDRVEPVISQALVRHSYQQIAEIRKDIGGNRGNDLPGYRTRIFDGNHIGKTEHRLKETRDITAAPLPGKSLVVLDPRFEAIADYFCIEDGHAQERSALDELLTTVKPNDLWVGDRNFCTIKPICEIHRRKAAFIIRHHKNLIGESLGKRRKTGQTETGTVYERTMTISINRQGETMTLRRIEVDLFQPTRDGDTTISILTNLPTDVADATKVAELYRTRWKIETAFQVLTTTLNCEINTLCYPKAALFVFALALVAYNSLAVIQAVIAKGRGREFAQQMSYYYMALEIAETTDGMLVALPLEKWIKASRTTLKKFNLQLLKIAANIDLSIYQKSTRGPKKSKPKKKHLKNKVHVSTAKILAQRKLDSAC